MASGDPVSICDKMIRRHPHVFGGEKLETSEEVLVQWEKIKRKEVAVGTHIKIGNQVVTDILCHCGFDIMWVDGEHGPMDRKDINQQILTLKTLIVQNQFCTAPLGKQDLPERPDLPHPGRQPRWQ